VGVRDNAGNFGQQQIFFTIDTVPPAAPVSSSITRTTTRVTFFGDTEPDVVGVEATIQDADLESAVVASWSAVVRKTVSNTFTLRARLRDAAGNYSDWSEFQNSFLVGGGSPDLNIDTFKALNAKVQDQNANGTNMYYFTQGQVTLVAHVSGGTSPITATIDGVETTANADQYSASLQFEEGRHTSHITVVDANGNIAIATAIVVVDRTPPVLTVIDASPATRDDQSGLLFTFPFNDIVRSGQYFPKKLLVNKTDSSAFKVKYRVTDAFSPVTSGVLDVMQSGEVVDSITATVEYPDSSDKRIAEFTVSGVLGTLDDGDYSLEFKARDALDLSQNEGSVSFVTCKDTKVFEQEEYTEDGSFAIVRRIASPERDVVAMWQDSIPLERSNFFGSWNLAHEVDLTSSTSATLNIIARDIAGNEEESNSVIRVTVTPLIASSDDPEGLFYTWGGPFIDNAQFGDTFSIQGVINKTHLEFTEFGPEVIIEPVLSLPTTVSVEKETYDKRLWPYRVYDQNGPGPIQALWTREFNVDDFPDGARLGAAGGVRVFAAPPPVQAVNGTQASDVDVVLPREDEFDGRDPVEADLSYGIGDPQHVSIERSRDDVPGHISGDYVNRVELRPSIAFAGQQAVFYIVGGKFGELGSVASVTFSRQGGNANRVFHLNEAKVVSWDGHNDNNIVKAIRVVVDIADERGVDYIDENDEANTDGANLTAGDIAALWDVTISSGDVQGLKLDEVLNVIKYRIACAANSQTSASYGTAYNSVSREVAYVFSDFEVSSSATNVILIEFKQSADSHLRLLYGNGTEAASSGSYSEATTFAGSILPGGIGDTLRQVPWPSSASEITLHLRPTGTQADLLTTIVRLNPREYSPEVSAENFADSIVGTSDDVYFYGAYFIPWSSGRNSILASLQRPNGSVQIQLSAGVEAEGFGSSVTLPFATLEQTGGANLFIRCAKGQQTLSFTVSAPELQTVSKSIAVKDVSQSIVTAAGVAVASRGSSPGTADDIISIVAPGRTPAEALEKAKLLVAEEVQRAARENIAKIDTLYPLIKGIDPEVDFDEYEKAWKDLKNGEINGRAKGVLFHKHMADSWENRKFSVKLVVNGVAQNAEVWRPFTEVQISTKGASKGNIVGIGNNAGRVKNTAIADIIFLAEDVQIANGDELSSLKGRWRGGIDYKTLAYENRGKTPVVSEGLAKILQSELGDVSKEYRAYKLVRPAVVSPPSKSFIRKLLDKTPGFRNKSNPWKIRNSTKIATRTGKLFLAGLLASVPVATQAMDAVDVVTETGPRAEAFCDAMQSFVAESRMNRSVTKKQSEDLVFTVATLFKISDTNVIQQLDLRFKEVSNEIYEEQGKLVSREEPEPPDELVNPRYTSPVFSQDEDPNDNGELRLHRLDGDK
jgi:hypothetical protein